MMKTFAALLSVLLLAGPAFGLDAPKGPVVLTIKGKIGLTNGEGVARFDVDMLRALDRRTARIGTPWTQQPALYSGAYFKAVLNAVDARGNRMIVRALNDYLAEVPIGDAVRIETMLADEMDGKPMTIRDKGPLMLVYPFDIEPDLYNERYFARSVWQIKEIEVLP